MTLLVVGDSISFGYELSDLPSPLTDGTGNFYLDPATGHREIMLPSQLSYPALLANRLNMPCENLSLIGGSNDRIFRVTVEQVLKKTYDLVICSWTGTDRFDFTYQGEDLPLNVGSSKYNFKKFPWLKSFVTDHYNAEHMINRFFSQLICLQAWLKQQNQPYIFVNGLDLPIGNQHQYYIQHIDCTQFPTWGSSLTSWCKGLPHGPMDHMLEEGHELIADRIYTVLDELYQ